MDAENLRELYQQLIIDHGRHPRNFGLLEPALCTHQQSGDNPLCGDKLVLYLTVAEGRIQHVRFEGEGCAISMASASLMTEAIKGQTVSEAEALFQAFHQMLTEGQATESLKAQLGKLIVLGGVCAFPMRVKCATLAWHTLSAALKGGQAAVSTE